MAWDDCKFCTIHKYGVIVLNVVGLMLLSAVAYLYWNDIVSFCFSSNRSRRSRRDVNRRPQAQDPLQPENTIDLTGRPQDISYRAGELPSPVNDLTDQQEDPQMQIIRLQQQHQQFQLQQQQQQQYQQQPSVPQQIQPPFQQMPPPPPPLPLPPPQTAVQIAIPVPPQLRHHPAHHHKHNLDRKTRIQSPASPKTPLRSVQSPMAPPASLPGQDPARLPKADDQPPPQQQQQITPYESTGSDYFKQMLKGKKPVASISQYHHLKHNAKKGKKNKKAKDKNKADKDKNRGKAAEKAINEQQMGANLATAPPSGNKEVALSKFVTKKEETR